MSGVFSGKKNMLQNKSGGTGRPAMDWIFGPPIVATQKVKATYATDETDINQSVLDRLPSALCRYMRNNMNTVTGKTKSKTSHIGLSFVA